MNETKPLRRREGPSARYGRKGMDRCTETLWERFWLDGVEYKVSLITLVAQPQLILYLGWRRCSCREHTCYEPAFVRIICPTISLLTNKCRRGLVRRLFQIEFQPRNDPTSTEGTYSASASVISERTASFSWTIVNAILYPSLGCK